MRTLNEEEIIAVAGGGLVGDIYAIGMEAVNGIGLNIPEGEVNPVVKILDYTVENTVDTVQGATGALTDFLGNVVAPWQ